MVELGLSQSVGGREQSWPNVQTLYINPLDSLSETSQQGLGGS